MKRRSSLVREIAFLLILILIFIVPFAAAIVIKANVWSECRRGGHSLAYCHALISR